MRVSVVVFPGTNCEHDAEHLFGKVLGAEVNVVWHRSEDLLSPDLVIIPGGFSYGDYLRTGALAKLSPVMKAIKNHATRGGFLLGICNGFQILCEAGLLPGVLLQNKKMRFLSQFTHLKVENINTPFTKGIKKDAIITCPIAHFDGNYFTDPKTLAELEKNEQVVFRYCSAEGEVAPEDFCLNPNGSLNAIAGISNRDGNIVGLMPHPERAPDTLVGAHAGAAGASLFAHFRT